MVKGKVAEMVQNERLGGLDVLEAEFSKTWEFKSHNVAGYSIQGRRDHVEDRLEVLTDLANKSHPSIFGIFDGHGGEVQSGRADVFIILSLLIMEVKYVSY
ncbi:protein phosphatase 1L-like [Equus caballus]